MKRKKIKIILLLMLTISILICIGINKNFNKLLSANSKAINSYNNTKTDTNSDKNQAVDVQNNNKDNYSQQDVSSVYEEVKIKYKDYIVEEGTIDENIIQYLDSKLQLIPENLVLKYFEQGGRILITDKDISNTYYKDYNFGRVIGMHDARKNIVYISNSEYAIDNALIHEFGHVLDSLTDWSSMKGTFSDIFYTEKDTFEVYSVDNHYKTNEREFFAEVFQQFILEPDSCKSSAPQSYEFIKNKLNELI